MKKLIITLLVVLIAFSASAQKKEKVYNEKGEIIKKGWNFGPLPVVGYNSDGYIYNISVEAKIIGKVKGLNVVGIQIGGRKSLINVGAVVGYITTSNTNKTNIKNIQATASIACEADNNQVNTNGWYGNTDLEDLGRIESRVRVF